MFIVLGVTGGIAAYKSVALARLIVEAGHELHVIPTDDALRFVGKPTWEAISRNPVTTSVHEDVPEVRHVALGQKADLIVVAPATANSIAKVTSGLADDLLGTTLLASLAPVLVAPAMHTEMWQHPSTQHNIAVLRERGVHFIGPESGRLTGADTGPGRMSEPADIFAAAEALLSQSSPADPHSSNAAAPQDYAGLSVMVSAGGTREPIDPVRFIGNRSSGKQGVAVAVAAAARGAREVTLLSANVDASVLEAVSQYDAITIVEVGRAAELAAAANIAAPRADIVVMAAAVSDYRIENASDHKLRKEDAGGSALTLNFVENPDILAGLVQGRRAGQTMVGFAAETAETVEELVERGMRKRERKGVQLLAVNSVGWTEGFESNTNTLHLIDDTNTVTAVVSGSKLETAHGLLDAILAQRSTR